MHKKLFFTVVIMFPVKCIMLKKSDSIKEGKKNY